MSAASHVSRVLRATGLGVVPTRTREGLYVTGSFLGVTVTAQHDHERQASRAIANATLVLQEAGYTVQASKNPHIIHVTRSKP